MGSIDIVTKQDLEEFETRLLSKIKAMLEEQQTPPTRKWMKTYQVREMLGEISAGTMQTMRNSGMLPFSLLTGLALYEYADVVKLMEDLKIAIPDKKNKSLKPH